VHYSLLATNTVHGSDYEVSTVGRLLDIGPNRVFATNQANAGRTLPAWSDSLTFEVLGNLAHELRTPIQALMGRLEMLQEEYADQIGNRPRELVQRMNVNALELRQTLENLLAFMVAKAGAETDTAEHLTIGSIVADIEPMITAANANKGLTIRFDLERAPVVIRAPRRAVTATITNLGLNAVKFTEAGWVTIAIGQVLSASNKHLVETEVSDSGPGLSPALFEEMSQPFAQLSRSNTRRFRGVGLGLAIVRQNVTRLGGTIELHSEPGHGASFLVRFPQARKQTVRTLNGVTQLPAASRRN
jgi:signal transduction histidine kinase